MDSDTRDKLRQVGESMPVGAKTRTEHFCGPGGTLLVVRDIRRIRGWCFRCNEGWSVTLQPSIQENLAYMQELAQRETVTRESRQSVEMPGPRFHFEEWPTQARLWFLKAGLSGQDAIRLDAGWHPGLGRVVMPLRDANGVSRGWIGRAVDGRPPKYLSGPISSGFVAECVPPGIQWAVPPIVVEDWLSANRIMQAGFRAICTLGTHPKTGTLLCLVKNEEVWIWLDNDLPPVYPVNRGQIAAMAIAKTLRGFGVRVRNIISSRDPKYLPLEEIRRILAPSAGAAID